MIVKQMDKSKALELASKGHEINVLIPTGGVNGWKGYETDILQNLLDGVLFFWEEPATPNPIFEKVIDDRVAPTLQLKENKPVGKKAIDVGKIRALSKAGWTQKQIADEMRLSQSTVNRHLHQGEKGEEESDGGDHN